MKKTLTSLSIIFACFSALAQGIEGNIKDEDGIGMPNASIFVKEISSGTATNMDGNYRIRLNPGQYHVTYQFIGYATQSKVITVGNELVTVDVKMQPQSLTLATVQLSSKAEDPAYTIMRKAIAKAEFHLLQYDFYSAEVYMKGTGKMDKIPGLFRKKLEKEGLDTNRVYTSESVSEIYYERPNIFKEKVISVRTSGEDEANANPNAYLNSSFYLPKVVDGISPLAPNAFSYYRFKYLGSFLDQGFEINKILVTPRARGENVYSGIIYIRENYYNIHSLELSTQLQGFDFTISQNYAPVKNEVWMPVTQKFLFTGSILGFGFSYKYLASSSNYTVKINEDLNASVYLIDEKIDDVPEDVVEVDKGDSEKGMEEVFKEDKKITRKEFNKLMNEYEKEELRKEKEGRKNEPVIIGDYSYSIDSAAAKKDSLYWENRRPVPLTTKETMSYAIDDSVYVQEVSYAKQDSARRANGDPIRFGDIFDGAYYKLGGNTRFSFDGFLPHFRFNTVEGWNLDFTGDLFWRHDTTLRLKFRPYIRYGFDSEQWYGRLKTTFGFGRYPKRDHFEVDGGKYIYQFNRNAIDPTINTLYTLLLVRNYMRLYDKDFLKITYRKKLNYKFSLSASAEWASRNELFNNSRWSLVDRKGYQYQLNEPENIETTTGGFSDSRAFVTSLTVAVKPWLKFYKYNGKLLPASRRTPEFRLTYNAGWNDVFESETDYQQLELGFNMAVDLGIKAIFDFDISGGSFLSNNQLEFMDYKHFDGGLTEIAPLGVTGNYRVLDYYNYSTSSNYISFLSHVNIRKFVFTQIPYVRLAGIKENIILNYLKTEYSPNYYEVGYGIDNIFRVLRIEFVQSFNDDQLGDFGVRIGVSTNFGG